MNNKSFIINYLILLAADILVLALCNLPQVLFITVLPVMVMCLPRSVNTPLGMAIAFATGFAADFLTTGALGLSSAALVVLGLLRTPLLSLLFGDTLPLHRSTVAFTSKGFAGAVLFVLIPLAVFLAIYITIDGAGMRSLWFNCLRFIISLAADSLLSFGAAVMLTSDKKGGQWN